MNQQSSLLNYTRPKSVDWGFDDIWPSPTTQDWFRDWDRSVRREQMSNFGLALEDEVDYLSHDLHRAVHRQFLHGINEDASPYWHGRVPHIPIRPRIERTWFCDEEGPCLPGCPNHPDTGTV